MTKKEPKRPALEEGLLTALRAIDNQVAREMQRDPSALSEHGIQKWEPLSKRMELITTFLLDALGGEEVQLDSLIVLAQATTKALSLIASDLESEGLGKLRSQYCLETFQKIQDDAYRGIQVLKDERILV